MATKGAVLCGGEGRRLRPLTDYIQKTMVPIGPHRRPLLRYVVRLLVHYGVKDIALLTGYKAGEIEGYFRDGSRFGAKITYSRDTARSGGSANALNQAISNGRLGHFENLLVYYGDVLSNLDVSDLIALHDSREAAVTMVLSDRYSLPVGVADVEDGYVKRFREKPSMGLSVATGCMVLRRTALPVLNDVSSRSSKRDLMTHFVPEVLDSGFRVAAYYFKGFWYDVGTTEAYEKLENRIVETHLRFLG